MFIKTNVTPHEGTPRKSIHIICSILSFSLTFLLCLSLYFQNYNSNFMLLKEKAGIVSSQNANSFREDDSPVHAFSHFLTDDEIYPTPYYWHEVTEKNWFEDENYQNLVRTNFSFEISEKKCVLCPNPSFTTRKPKSSKQDLIITLMTGTSMNALTFIRTLRSTGCKATVIVFVDDCFLKNLTSVEYDVLYGCGVITINIGKLMSKYAQHLFESRHILFYQFLKENRKYFGRVLEIDMADTIFQADPFNSKSFDLLTFAFTTEGYNNNNDPPNNTKWIKVADPDYFKNPMFYDDKVVINGGFFYGGIEGFMHFYKTYFGQLKCYKDFEIETIDQGYMNYLFHRGIFLRAGLNITLTYPGDYLMSVRGRNFDPSPNQDGLFFLRDTVSPPAAIHQYNRIRPVLEGIKRTCPRLGREHQFPFPFFKA